MHYPPNPFRFTSNDYVKIKCRVVSSHVVSLCRARAWGGTTATGRPPQEQSVSPSLEFSLVSQDGLAMPDTGFYRLLIRGVEARPVGASASSPRLGRPMVAARP